MQRSAAVINVSRGAVIDESALLDALQTGRIAGAGLDVFVEEPVPPDHPLLALDTVVATPHVAGVTRQNYDAIAQVVAANIARVKQGNSPQYRANSAV
jgi:phosphoglycerate dehydrogenase-like enzyme